MPSASDKKKSKEEEGAKPVASPPPASPEKKLRFVVEGETVRDSRTKKVWSVEMMMKSFTPTTDPAEFAKIMNHMNGNRSK